MIWFCDTYEQAAAQRDTARAVYPGPEYSVEILRPLFPGDAWQVVLGFAA